MPFSHCYHYYLRCYHYDEDAPPLSGLTLRCLRFLFLLRLSALLLCFFSLRFLLPPPPRERAAFAFALTAIAAGMNFRVSGRSAPFITSSAVLYLHCNEENRSIGRLVRAALTRRRVLMARGQRLVRDTVRGNGLVRYLVHPLQPGQLHSLHFVQHQPRHQRWLLGSQPTGAHGLDHRCSARPLRACIATTNQRHITPLCWHQGDRREVVRRASKGPAVPPRSKFPVCPLT
jgi:hypothetical protein